MTAYDPTSGELRTHYAGFFDPGFGFDPAGRFPGLPGRARGARPRRPVHGRERPGGVQADVRAHARGARRALRIGHRLVVPAAGGDPQPVLPARSWLTRFSADRARSSRLGLVRVTRFVRADLCPRFAHNSGSAAPLHPRFDRFRWVDNRIAGFSERGCVAHTQKEKDTLGRNRLTAAVITCGSDYVGSRRRGRVVHTGRSGGRAGSTADGRAGCRQRRGGRAGTVPQAHTAEPPAPEESPSSAPTANRPMERWPGCLSQFPCLSTVLDERDRECPAARAGLHVGHQHDEPVVARSRTWMRRSTRARSPSGSSPDATSSCSTTTVGLDQAGAIGTVNVPSRPRTTRSVCWARTRPRSASPRANRRRRPRRTVQSTPSFR